MPVRKVQAIGGGTSTSFGVTLDRTELELDGVLDDLEAGEEVRAVVSRDGPGRYSVELVEMLDRAEQATAD